MRGFVVVVDFRLKAGASEAFRALIVENAKASVRDEPGCRHFDVVLPHGEADRVVLYEIYDDRAAFDAHVRTPHYAAFDRASQPFVASKSVMLGDLAYAGAGV
ncbi:MAG: putative quinol monooxygenase [Alphaproteobacteria bacterium]